MYNSIKSKPIKIILIAMVALMLSEILLQLLGYQPGYWGDFEGFHRVDSLIVAKNLVTDEYGIYKFRNHNTHSLKEKSPQNWANSMLNSDESERFIENILYANYIRISFNKLQQQIFEKPNLFTKLIMDIFLEDKEDWETEFTKFYDKLSQKGSLNQLDKATLNYVSSPFNQEGFRSIEFQVHDTSKTRVLLIGDSFVYGLSSRPLFNSYSDLLLARGYEVYNTGIPGADPAQYAAIAKKYIPILKPDLVMLNFYDGNDLMWFPREAAMGKPNEHITNAGFFESYPLGKYLSSEQAYDYYLSLTQIPKITMFDITCSKSAIGSMIWGILLKNEVVEHQKLNEYYAFRIYNEDDAISITKSYLMTIDSICKSFGIPLINVIIPDVFTEDNADHDYVKINKARADKLFGKNYYNPDGIFTPDDFGRVDIHFNNSGSLKFANYLEEIINDNAQAN